MNENNETNGEPRQDIGALIQAAIQAGQSLKKDPSVDKKWLNKTVARLEEADAFASRIYKSNSLNNPANMASLAASAGECICPPGAKDTSCPVHGARSNAK